MNADFHAMEDAYFLRLEDEANEDAPDIDENDRADYLNDLRGDR